MWVYRICQTIPNIVFLSVIIHTFLGLFFLNLNKIGDVKFGGQSNTASDFDPFKRQQVINNYSSKSQTIGNNIATTPPPA